MKSGTAAYWLPVTVDSIDHTPQEYEGFGTANYSEIHDWITDALDVFKHIYGSVIDVYYVVDRVFISRDQNYDFMINIVVTGITNSELDFDNKISNQWPSDLVEQLKVAFPADGYDSFVGYDLNPITSDPVWSNFNQ